MDSPKTSEAAPRLPLCREPWQNYYILRRGILPCCYGHKAIAPMSEWRTAWNAPALQEIRSFLAKGQLSPYCLQSISCPIVQRDLDKKRRESVVAAVLEAPQHSRSLRLVNSFLGGLPGRIYHRFRG